MFDVFETKNEKCDCFLSVKFFCFDELFRQIPGAALLTLVAAENGKEQF